MSHDFGGVMNNKTFRAGFPAFAFIFATPAFATPLANCGASSGQAYYASEGSWAPDKISDGSYSFAADDKGNPNVYFKDASGRVIDAAADGAKVTFSFLHADIGEFGIVVVYEEEGVVETFNVINSSSGSRMLYWTTNRSNSSPLAKVSAFVAKCR